MGRRIERSVAQGGSGRGPRDHRPPGPGRPRHGQFGQAVQVALDRKGTDRCAVVPVDGRRTDAHEAECGRQAMLGGVAVAHHPIECLAASTVQPGLRWRPASGSAVHFVRVSIPHGSLDIRPDRYPVVVVRPFGNLGIAHDSLTEGEFVERGLPERTLGIVEEVPFLGGGDPQGTPDGHPVAINEVAHAVSHDVEQALSGRWPVRNDVEHSKWGNSGAQDAGVPAARVAPRHCRITLDLAGAAIGLIEQLVVVTAEV